jgi:hypothetical protein
MPSNKRQINVRVSDAAVARLAAVTESMARALGFSVSQADAIEAALIELEKKYPAAGSGGAPPANAAEGPAGKEAKGKGRRKK